MKHLLTIGFLLLLSVPAAAQTVLFAQRVNINQTATPTTGGTVTVSNSAAPNIHLILTPTGALLSLTVNLPSTPIDGQTVTIFTTQTITTLTLGGGTIVNALTTLTSNAFGTYIYNLSDTKWYQIN